MWIILLPMPEDAVRHFEDALAGNDHIGARPWLAWTQYDYAAALLRRANDERGTMNDQCSPSAAAEAAHRHTECAVYKVDRSPSLVLHLQRK